MKNSNKHKRSEKKVAEKLQLFRVPGTESTGDLLKEIPPGFVGDPLDVSAIRTMLRQRGLRVEKREGRWEIILPTKRA